MIDARCEIESIVSELVDEHIRALESEASRSHDEESRTCLAANIAANSKHAQPALPRRGVAPGSFVDLLVKRNRTPKNSETFSSECITQQVSHLKISGERFMPNLQKVLFLKV